MSYVSKQWVGQSKWCDEIELVTQSQGRHSFFNLQNTQIKIYGIPYVGCWIIGLFLLKKPRYINI